MLHRDRIFNNQTIFINQTTRVTISEGNGDYVP